MGKLYNPSSAKLSGNNSGAQAWKSLPLPTVKGLNPLTPMLLVTGRDKPWPLIHFCCHHL